MMYDMPAQKVIFGFYSPRNDYFPLQSSAYGINSMSTSYHSAIGDCSCVHWCVFARFPVWPIFDFLRILPILHILPPTGIITKLN